MTAISATQAGFFEISEVRERLVRISSADLSRLEAIARIRGNKISGWNWDDLLQEAFERVLDGRRRWPVSVGLVPYFAEVMRSVAGGQRKKQENDVVATARSVDTSSEFEGTIELEHPVACDDFDYAALRDQLLDAFSDDNVAHGIVVGMMAGARGEDLRKTANLDPKAYQSKRKLIRRRISKLVGDEEGMIHE